ncbi:MAG: pitrilysin family protein [Candidatus Microsaccharimonas sp.]
MPLRHSVEELVLKNGMRGLLIDVPESTVVNYEIHFRAGNYYAPSPAVQQTAHIMEHLAFCATSLYPTQEIFSQEFTKNGAYHNATTWQYEMSYYADCALMEWDRILNLQRLVVSEPLLTEEFLKAEKGNVREELTGQANNRRRIIWQRTLRAMGDEFFLDPEKIETIPAVTLDHVKQHHQKTHTLKNMRFSIAGDLKKHKREIISQLEDWKLPKGTRLDIPAKKLHSAPPVAVYRADMPSINFIIVIALNRKCSEEEKTTLNALSHILTGSFHSRIFGKARARGLCYGMGSGLSVEADDISRFELYGQVSIKNAAPLFELIAEELAKVVAGDISNDELDVAKQFALGSHQMNGQTVEAVNAWYASQYFEDGLINIMEKAPSEINAVTVEHITELTKEFIETGVWTVGVIGAMRKPQVKELYDIMGNLMDQRVE